MFLCTVFAAISKLNPSPLCEVLRNIYIATTLWSKFQNLL